MHALVGVGSGLRSFFASKMFFVCGLAYALVVALHFGSYYCSLMIFSVELID